MEIKIIVLWMFIGKEINMKIVSRWINFVLYYGEGFLRWVKLKVEKRIGRKIFLINENIKY